MFEILEELPPDPILGVTAAFKRDPSPKKVDLGVGVYRDEKGVTPVPRAVVEAQRQLIASETTKSYVGPVGNVEFNERIVGLALGSLASKLASRTATIQSVGGCGALRLGAELVRSSKPDALIHVSDPTWANHEPLIGSAGVKLERYPYFDAARQAVAFDAMHDYIGRLPSGAVVLLHACCHNPTGADLSEEQWRVLAETFERRGLVPFVDMAYQGFGDDLDTDARGLRMLAERVPELLLALSCSKNFGLYKERVGALAIIAKDAKTAAAITTHERRQARRMYSMPPDHGAVIASRILADESLRKSWIDEVGSMVARMKSLRALLASRLVERMPERDWNWLNQQRGMFSLLGLTDVSIQRLRDEHHVYVPPDGRMNVAGISDQNVDYVADAVTALLR